MDTSSHNFGLVVAYLLPGFVGLFGVAALVPNVRQWLLPTVNQSAAGVGPPVYALLAATATGMVLSCFRWLLIDHLHQWLGVPKPLWDIDRLNDRLGAFNQLVEYHYRYYQFYANTLIGLLFTYGINRWIGTSSLLSPVTDVGVAILCAALLAGSRDALAKYYARTSRLIGQVESNELKGETMTNGCHHDQAGNAANKRREAKPQGMPKSPKTRPTSEKTAAISK